MTTLTTRQRDILRILLEANRPVGAVEIAGLLHLTPRQVSYCMHGIKVWLKQHNQTLEILPGTGFAASVSPDEARALWQEINFTTSVQIILSVSQRQQLLALFLLTTSEPLILMKLHQIAQVSRSTLLKDLDEIEAWLLQRQITLVRKPNYGIQVQGAEQACQQALAELLWGETPFSSDPVTRITHADGLVFNLKRDAGLLPLVEHANTLFSEINMRRAIGLIAKAEEELGGRFTDDAVLHLALVYTILALRVQTGHHIEVDKDTLSWLQELKIWPVATYVAKRIGRDSFAHWKPADIAGIAIEMMAAPRNEILPGEFEHYGDFSALLERVMETISEAFGISKIKHDHTLQNGLLSHIAPACVRQRFNLWFPLSLNTASLPERYEKEREIAQAIVDLVYEDTGIHLPQAETNNLVVLLRAAHIRNRSYRFDRIFVVCPSGMATAQLLVARLHARFPQLSGLEVISMRDLTPTLVSSADLILTTVPLPHQFATHPKVMQVHPLLMPEDIESITRFLR